MSEYHPIEQEIIQKTNFIPEKKYRKRQDYLAALLRAVGDMSDEQWDGLTDAAAAWSHSAAFVHGQNKEHNKNDPLPDFNGAQHDATADYDTGGEVQDNSELSHSENGELHEEQEASPEDERGMGSIQQTETHTPKRVQKAKTAKVKQAKPKKDKASPKGLNPWGVVIGTKSDFVCKMLARPEGATQKEISEATGQTHYNLCNRLQRHGFAIRKDGNRLWLVSKEKGCKALAT